MSSLAGYRRVSLDSDPLNEDDEHERRVRRLMQELPTPASERKASTVTRNGNLVQRQAR